MRVKNFEILNDEKITPNFINLSKGAKSEASLMDLKKEDGQNFKNENERKAYVRDFYRNLYKIPECDLDFTENCIEDFWAKKSSTLGL